MRFSILHEIFGCLSILKFFGNIDTEIQLSGEGAKDGNMHILRGNAQSRIHLDPVCRNRRSLTGNYKMG